MNVDNLVFSRNNRRPIEQDEVVGRRAGIFIALGLFATPYVLRHRIIPGSEAVWALNPLVLLSVAWLLLYMLGHKYSMSRSVSVVVSYCLLVWSFLLSQLGCLSLISSPVSFLWFFY